MSRSGYSDSCEGWELIRWRGQVKSAIRGKRGQSLLREMLEALDAMPQKRLIANALEKDGEVCALGSLGRKRGIDMTGIDPHEYETVAAKFGVARQLVQEIAYLNDECTWRQTPEERWKEMRDWVQQQLESGKVNSSREN